jgi:hypothetical protein
LLSSFLDDTLSTPAYPIVLVAWWLASCLIL